MADQRDKDDLLTSLFPIGEERWVKVKYLDFEKCVKIFNVGPNEKRKAERNEKYGFECTAIGIRPEYVPQVSAIMDLRDDIISSLSFILEDYQLDQLNRIFKAKIDEVKERTIREV